jgi:hypothetical protein
MPSATLTEYGVRLLTGLRLIELFEKESSDYPLFWLLSPYIAYRVIVHPLSLILLYLVSNSNSSNQVVSTNRNKANQIDNEYDHPITLLCERKFYLSSDYSCSEE